MVPPVKQEHGNVSCGREKRQLPAGNSSPSKRQATASHDAEDVIVFTPPKEKVEAVDLLSDSPQVILGHTTNPNILFPHGRANCGVYKLEESPESFCEKCYCVVCEIPAKNCPSWSQHCRAIAKPTPKTNTITPNQQPAAVDTIDLTAELSRETLSRFLPPSRRRFGRFERDDYDGYNTRGRNSEKRFEKPPSEMLITEVFSRKLTLAIQRSDAGRDQEQGIVDEEPELGNNSKVNRIAELEMDGDIGGLKLQRSFFVEGVRIGWHFPEILPPQRQMAIHIIRALKRKLHVVLESPTGTGKSAAILCSVLAWQRYQAHRQKRNNEKSNDYYASNSSQLDFEEQATVPTVIYCSRTHSQVAQMVESLKKTPYRPRMTVLGSRDRLCINRDLIGNKAININFSCRDRKRATDAKRKKLMSGKQYVYDDSMPHIPQTGEVGFVEQEGQDDSEEQPGEEEGRQRHVDTPICTHYMNLTRETNVKGIQSRFVQNTKEIACCSAGGEKSPRGVHDIEDLVAFGKNPYQEKHIAIYREGGTGSFGIILANRDGGGCEVVELRQGLAAAKNGRLQPGDWVVAINGKETKAQNLNQMVRMIRELPTDPLVLDVLRGKGIDEANEAMNHPSADPYSEEAVCPYYVSRALKSHSDLIFAPYNYILDPVIRKSMQLSLKDAVVVLDEAHNVEDTLNEGGSADFSEIELCQMMVSLALISNSGPTGSDDANMVDTQLGSIHRSEVAHELLLFFEVLLKHMRLLRQKFETSPGLQKVISEHSRYKLQDDHEVEVKYSGPTGYGLRGEAVGCAPLLDELQITPSACEKLEGFAEALESHLSRNGEDPDQAIRDVSSVFVKLALASKKPEHFYMACIMKPNGNMDYATCMEEARYLEQMEVQKWRKKPRSMPFVSPRTKEHPKCPMIACRHKECMNTDSRGYMIPGRAAVYHGSFANGETPRWECHLVLRLLSPGLMLGALRESCRTLILASGSLAPLPSLCSELNLYGPKSTSNVGVQHHPSEKTQTASQGTLSQASPALEKGSNSHAKTSLLAYGRLQTKPKPLEANHVVNLAKQLFAVSIGHFPDGSPLTVSYSNYKEASFFPRLGHSVATIVESVPRGGILVFFPSYAFLKKCIKCWNPGLDTRGAISPQIWSRLVRAKGKVIIEPSGSQEKFEAARAEYTNKIKEDGNCVLLAVFRGKMSEGISFNDDNARCVICIGLPLPSFTDRAIKAKRSYNDEQRKIRKNTNLLPGAEWYSQQAYRAVAQALGRCIRHGADYGSVILLDSRHCDDGSPNSGICEAHQKLPKWMRNHVRTLSMHPSVGYGNNPVLGGYPGLAGSLSEFFRQAPAEAEKVRRKWQLDLQKAQARAMESQRRSFNTDTGDWTVLSKLSEGDDMKVE